LWPSAGSLTEVHIGNLSGGDCCGLCFVLHFCLWQTVLYIYWNYIFFKILQENINTVTVEAVKDVGEEDWIEIETEADYRLLVGGVNCEQEVSVLCCVFCDGDLCTCVCVCACVLYCTLCSVTHSLRTCISHHFSFCLSTSRCTPVIHSI
jgi:hypothetical protein